VNGTKSTQFAPKFAYLRSKINFFSGQGLPLPKWGGGHPSPHPAPPPRLDPLAYGARTRRLWRLVSPILLILEPPLFGSYTSSSRKRSLNIHFALGKATYHKSAYINETVVYISARCMHMNVARQQREAEAVIVVTD